MLFRKTLFPTLVILILSVILGFANNLINPYGVLLTAERPTAPISDDSIFAADPSAQINQPVVIGKTQLKTLMREENVIIIDARMPEEFAITHIRGAINIPFDLLGDFIQQVDELPRDKWLVPYCEGPPCDKGEMLAHELFHMGFDKVAYYHAGLDNWKTNGDIKQ